jgi:hypothetical protein
MIFLHPIPLDDNRADVDTIPCLLERLSAFRLD